MSEVHPLLQLPYAIWSSIAAAGLIWEENLSPTNARDLPEYRVRVHRVLRGKKPRHELLFRYDGSQYRLVEATNRLPRSIAGSFDWRLRINVEMVESLLKGGPRALEGWIRK